MTPRHTDPPTPPGQQFAQLIRTARKARGWTQDRLADESGVERTTIIRYESGQSTRPAPPEVRAVCLALGIDPREAAIALGYLTREEVERPTSPDRLRAEFEDFLRFRSGSTDNDHRGATG